MLPIEQSLVKTLKFDMAYQANLFLLTFFKLAQADSPGSIPSSAMFFVPLFLFLPLCLSSLPLPLSGM
jgi:hypothetical protein